MSNRYYTHTREKISAPDGPKGTRGKPGAEKSKRVLSDTQTKWPDPGPHWGVSFNRAAKMPVVKTKVVKGGVD